MADLPIGQLWNWLFPTQQPVPPPQLYNNLMNRPGRQINPALLDSNLHPYDPAGGGPRFDRYREDEPGVQEWVRRHGSRLDEGSGTAPAVPPQMLNGGMNADPRGEIPNPMQMREYFRARNLDIGKV
jgi:hypothetical protein